MAAKVFKNEKDMNPIYGPRETIYIDEVDYFNH